MDHLSVYIVDILLLFLSIDTGYALLSVYNLDRRLMEQCIDPIRHFSKMFKYPRSLLAAMADEGCVVTGSQSLEFYEPGSTDTNSGWDIYVPGNIRAITNILAVLEECGVQ